METRFGKITEFNVDAKSHCGSWRIAQDATGKVETQSKRFNFIAGYSQTKNDVFEVMYMVPHTRPTRPQLTVLLDRNTGELIEQNGSLQDNALVQDAQEIKRRFDRQA